MVRSWHAAAATGGLSRFLDERTVRTSGFQSAED